MEWMPAGRGLWAMGSEYVYKKGSMALNNCGACDTTDLPHAAEWAMDALMCGVGVGFNTAWRGEASKPDKSKHVTFVIPDSKEGWVESLKYMIESYTKGGRWHLFDYSLIRPYGTPIKGFGGKASGYAPLKRLHERAEKILDDYCEGVSDKTRCVVDLFNSIGACVVAGNVRRSAEIALGSIDDKTFLDLKNYEINPDRKEIGWISNNSVVLQKSEDLKKLKIVAEHIVKNGEPGILNLINVKKYGRYGEEKKDSAYLSNPCGEVPLESFELCNLAELFPSRCIDEKRFFKALEFATFYTSTVTLLPTHRRETNEVVFKNRRIGVSISGIVDALEEMGKERFFKMLDLGYMRAKEHNKSLAEEAGIPASVRVTTVKPSGTISFLAGVNPGMHHPPFRYALRRIRISDSSPLCRVLKKSGLNKEDDLYSPNTMVFEFPICYKKGKELSSTTASEQFELLADLQRVWSDNMVSCTIAFDRDKEADRLPLLLEKYVPLIKSVSLLPHTKKGVYKQMPYECITKEEYEKMTKVLQPVEWSGLRGSDGQDSRFCYEGECGI